MQEALRTLRLSMLLFPSTPSLHLLLAIACFVYAIISS
jgi:hypothetical protein